MLRGQGKTILSYGVWENMGCDYQSGEKMPFLRKSIRKFHIEKAVSTFLIKAFLFK